MNGARRWNNTEPRWLEEPFQTYKQIETLSRLRQMTTIPIATGEHNYNRWDSMSP